MFKNRGRSVRRDTRDRAEKDAIHELKAIVRRQRKVIQQLRKELSKVGKVSEEYTRLIEDLEAREFQERKVPKVQNCTSCGKGVLKTSEIGKFTFVSCTLCDYRHRMGS